MLVFVTQLLTGLQVDMLKAKAEEEREEILTEVLTREATHEAVFEYGVQHKGDLILLEGDPVVQISELADGWAKGWLGYSCCFFTPDSIR